MDDNYSASDFDSCMVAAANQQRDVNSQSQAEQVQTQDDHDKQQQQTDQTHQITQQVQPVTPSNMPLTPIRLPAILDGEFFTVTKVEDSNVTVRCSYCQRFLNGNLKSTGNFLSHIKRVHPFLVEKIKCKSSQRKPAMLYVDLSATDKCSDPVRVKRYKQPKIEECATGNESYENSPDWNDTTLIRRRTVEDHSDIVDSRVTTHNSLVIEDEYDAIGRNVAAKLRNMHVEQRIIAEKLLNDILFEAQLGNLSRNSNIHV